MDVILEKLRRSWLLFERSVQVIRQHPKLLLFPIVTALLTSAIALFFVAPVALMALAPQWIAGSPIQAIADRVGFLRSVSGGNFHFVIQPLGSAVLAGLYLLDMFLASMASVAFYSQILCALGGQPVSIQGGLAAACSRWKAVLFWSLLAGTVGLVIRAIEKRFSLLGRLVGGFIGLAWSVAAVFAIPILVREPSLRNPFAVLSKSAATIKRTWGEMLTGYAGMQGTNLLFAWLSVVFWVGASLAAILFRNAWLLVPAGLWWVLCLVVYSYLASTASQVYLCALYLYASEGVVPGPYDATMMNLAWKMKKK